MKSYFLMSLTGALAISFSSCREDLRTEMLNEVPLQVTTTTGTDGRTIHESPVLPSGSELGVSIFDGFGKPYEDRPSGVINVPYRLQNINGKDVWQADVSISLSATEGKAVAYYPYSASVTDIHAIPVDVTKSQTDHMYSGWVSSVSATNPQADFTLRHALCAVQVNITDGGYTRAGKVTSVSVSSPALATVATLDAADGSFPSFSGQDTPVTSTEGFTIGKDPQSAFLLAVPTSQAAGLSIHVAMDGKTFTIPFPSSIVTFLPGKVYTVNLTAKDGGVPFEVSGTIDISTDWSTIVLQNPTMDPEIIKVPDRYVIEIEIPTDNFSFYNNVRHFTGVIDWGDGRFENYLDVVNPVHVYEKAGKYIVTAKGISKSISWFGDETGSNKCLTNILYIGGEMGITSMQSAFEGCTNLKTLRKGIFDNLTKVTKFDITFEGCSNLASVPSGLFNKCTEVINFTNTFTNCSSLQSIPRIFDGCTKVEYFWSTFSGCSSLTSIPDGLFDSFTKIESFSNTFARCSSLRNIPAGLFDNCTIVNSFKNTFEECSSLQRIPAGLFDECTKVTDFQNTFYKCSSLQEIPAGLFDNCITATEFRNTFYGCSSLQEIPAGLFDNCTIARYFSNTFMNCIALKSIPQGLFNRCTEALVFDGTFYGCSSLTSIPRIFDGCTKVKAVIDSYGTRGTFEECSSLQSIPVGLFDSFVEVTNYARMFKNCTQLQSIPAGLFDKCTKVKSFKETFSGCKALQRIPAGLFDECTKVTDFQNTFYKCKTLQSIPDGLFNKCTWVKDFRNTFYSCSSLQSIPRIFDGCTKVESFENTFQYCSSLQSISSGLFNSCSKVNSFKGTFLGCEALQNIPIDLFDYCKHVTNFENTFFACSNLRGESPYSVINGKKIHLYERYYYDRLYFTEPKGYRGCFRTGTKLSDYDKIPVIWK